MLYFPVYRFEKDLLERNVFTHDKENSKLYELMSKRQIQQPHNIVQYLETRKAPHQPAPAAVYTSSFLSLRNISCDRDTKQLHPEECSLTKMIQSKEQRYS